MAESPSLLPPSPSIPPNVKLENVDMMPELNMTRPGFGTSRQPISSVASHFKATIRNLDEEFYQYNVTIHNEDNREVSCRRMVRKIMDKLLETFSYDIDGKKCLFPVGSLPNTNMEFTLILEDSFDKCSETPSCDGSPYPPKKKFRHSTQLKNFKVLISYACKIPLKSILFSLHGSGPKKMQVALRFLDTILRQKAANRGCLLVQQSFSHDDSRMFVGGGARSVREFYSKFHPIQAGLSLNRLHYCIMGDMHGTTLFGFLYKDKTDGKIAFYMAADSLLTYHEYEEDSAGNVYDKQIQVSDTEQKYAKIGKSAYVLLSGSADASRSVASSLSSGEQALPTSCLEALDFIRNKVKNSEKVKKFNKVVEFVVGGWDEEKPYIFGVYSKDANANTRDISFARASAGSGSYYAEIFLNHMFKRINPCSYATFNGKVPAIPELNRDEARDFTRRAAMFAEDMDVGSGGYFTAIHSKDGKFEEEPRILFKSNEDGVEGLNKLYPSSYPKILVEQAEKHKRERHEKKVKIMIEKRKRAYEEKNSSKRPRY